VSLSFLVILSLSASEVISSTWSVILPPFPFEAGPFQTIDLTPARPTNGRRLSAPAHQFVSSSFEQVLDSSFAVEELSFRRGLSPPDGVSAPRVFGGDLFRRPRAFPPLLFCDPGRGLLLSLIAFSKNVFWPAACRKRAFLYAPAVRSFFFF